MSGRPKAQESRDRTSRFLCLIAQGNDAETAAKAARISPWKALRIVTESDFNTIVQALQDGLAPDGVVVQLADHHAAKAA